VFFALVVHLVTILIGCQVGFAVFVNQPSHRVHCNQLTHKLNFAKNLKCDKKGKGVTTQPREGKIWLDDLYLIRFSMKC
jgi:hypothetical protein